MSDLDFDELDKAVSTLMGDVPKVDLPKADDVKTLNINSTLPNESRPSLSQLDSELNKVNDVTTPPVAAVSTPSVTPAPSLAARRGGRFMDVVHPSSDMKGTVKPSGSTSRQGVTIEPAATAAAVQLSSANAESVKDTVNVSTQPVESSDASETSGNDWPDPLDMNSFSAEPDTGNIAEAVAVTAPAVSLAVDDLEDDADMQPLVSPFLPDAKVEKRPLGGAPSEEVKENVASENEPSRAPALGVVASDDTATEDASEQLPTTPAAVERPLPPELQSDLMAIETDGGTSAQPAKTSVLESAVSEKPTEQNPPAVTLESPAQKPLGGAVAAVSAPAITGPTSIPQQYHEEPTTSDQTNGAIYDTDSYHQPLAHPAKTHSGWLWIIWILLLLMVGGGGAVALYFLGII